MNLPVRSIVGELAVCAALSACAPTFKQAAPDPVLLAATRREFATTALAAWHADRARLFRIAQQVFAGARELCKNSQHDSGLLLSRRRDLPYRLREEVARAGVMSDAPQLIAVAADSPAARAGLIVGDQLLAIDGTRVDASDAPENEIARRLGTRENGRTSVELLLRRAGAGEVRVDVGRRTTCAARVTLDPDSAFGGSFDGFTVTLTQGALHMLTDDAQLAFVIAHELGHKELGHIDRVRLHVFLGVAADMATSGGAVPLFTFSGFNLWRQDYEREADRFGLIAVERAGFDLERAATVWQTLALRRPSAVGLSWLPHHPMMAERHVRLQATAAQIRAQGASR